MHYVCGYKAYVLFREVVHICTFVWNCSWSVYTRKRFLLHKIEYILNILLNCRMDIVDQCSIVLLISVFDCHTNAFILKVHLMRLMHLCRHIRAPCSSLSLLLLLIIITTIPPSLPLFLSLPYTLLHFFPWSEFRSATALTHTHDETEWDTIWLRLTHTLGIEGFFFFLRAHVHTGAQSASHLWWCTHTRIIVGKCAPCPPISPPLLSSPLLSSSITATAPYKSQ